MLLDLWPALQDGNASVLAAQGDYSVARDPRLEPQLQLEGERLVEVYEELLEQAAEREAEPSALLRDMLEEAPQALEEREASERERELEARTRSVLDFLAREGGRSAEQRAHARQLVGVGLLALGVGLLAGAASGGDKPRRRR